MLHVTLARMQQDSEPLPCLLADLGVMYAHGAHCRQFLQGQLSQDLNTLAVDALTPAGLHNAAGRTLAVVWLAPWRDGIAALLPRNLMEEVLTTLRRFVLRAKVTLDDASDSCDIVGFSDAKRAPAGALRYPAGRAVHLQARGTTKVQSDRSASWQLADIAAGLPELGPATSGRFVAQMLNLDAIGAISFQKGCYTGQEVIARAHYRGRVKRRMQRFSCSASDMLAAGATLVAGESGTLLDGRAYQVSRSAGTDAGEVEWLAVAPMVAAGEVVEEAEVVAGSSGLAARTLPLPYDLESS